MNDKCKRCEHAGERAPQVRRARRLKLMRMFAEGRLVITHGTTHGYNYYGCRCVECTAAKAGHTKASRTPKDAAE